MKKRVAILIPSLSHGGAERVASRLSQYLDDEYEVFLILFDGSRIDYEHRGRVIDLKSKDVSKNPIVNLFKLLKRIMKVRKVKKTYHIDITVSFLEICNIVNLLSRKGDKIVISRRLFMDKKEGTLKDKLLNSFIKALYNSTDRMIAVSKMMKDDLVKNFGMSSEKTKVIYNPYDVEKIQSLCDEMLEEYERTIFSNPVIINVGRTIRQKGQWHLIRAFKKVKEAVPEAKLVIVGKSVERSDLEDYLNKLIKELGLEGSVHLFGFHKNPFKYIKQSRIFVLSSLYEGFPNALAEALACGIPVISTDCKSGPREILAPDTSIHQTAMGMELCEYGVLVPSCDGQFYEPQEPLTKEEDMLADSMVKLLQSEDLRSRYSKKSLERIEAFKADKIVTEWKDVLAVRK